MVYLTTQLLAAEITQLLRATDRLAGRGKSRAVMSLLDFGKGATQPVPVV